MSSSIERTMSANSEWNGIPSHIAVIMDGNGRWASERGLNRLEGHKAGASTVRMMVEECRRMGVRYLTLYTFSSENWNRPQEEVSGLMGLLAKYLQSELDLMLTNGIRLRAIGERSLLDPAIREVLESTEARTKNHSDMELILALSYGGRQEIVSAAQQIARRVRDNEIAITDISDATVQSAMYAPDVPDPDLLIRTGGDRRISNFLLWQIAYAEIVFTEKRWPEFSRDDLVASIADYQSRQRRFGLTGEQICESVGCL